MNTLSPWATAASALFHDQQPPTIFDSEICGYVVKVHAVSGSFWITITCPKGTRVLLRAAYAPADELQLGKVHYAAKELTVNLTAAIGHYKVTLKFPDEEKALIRYTTTLTAASPLLIPFWPRDMVVTGAAESDDQPQGTIHISQVGTRSGLQYVTFDEPEDGALLYFQNLTALNQYAQATETSLGNVVGGTWPEIGFALPPTIKERSIPAHREIILSDAFLVFTKDLPETEFDLAKQFLNLLADVYVHLPKPVTKYHNWPDIVNKGLHDLEFSHGCWSHGAGQDYLNAYVADYDTPPELMVQLAVMMPLTDYNDWYTTDLPAIQKIRNGLDAFYNKDIGTVVRWLPALAKDLDGKEEQLKPNVMDSWYLHHPLLNLGRLATRGDKQAEKLFLNSLDLAVKVAHHFKYEWPVFYNIKTLEVVKAETVPGKGGEKDVAGLYSLVMLHAWNLTKKDKYLHEAEKAAKTLQGKGFDLFYQANNTAFSANAMLWLYKETKKPLYLDLAYLCLANVFKNFQLWECDYGYAKYYATFFAMFPLKDAPYTAAYEEQEVFASMHNFMLYAEGEDILPSVNLLIPEFIKYIVNRAAYYYPPNLPAEMLSDEVKMGQVDPKLWIAIEDIHDGWEKSGEVGQEVYGAGVAFGIVPRHYYRVPDEHFMIYVDYPTSNFKYRKGSGVTFTVKGDERMSCRMLIVGQNEVKLPAFVVTINAAEAKGTCGKDGHIEFMVNGGEAVKIGWE